MMTEYDPNDPNDPLRHKFLERKVYSDFKIPWDVKVANAFNARPMSPVQRVAARMRSLGRDAANF